MQSDGNHQKDINHEALEQLAEKQVEEMDNMLAKRYGLPQTTHTNDKIRASSFADLFSEVPVYDGDDTAER